MVRKTLDAVATIMMIVAAGVIIFYRSPLGRGGSPPAKSLPASPISFSDANPKGSPSAKLVLVEYSDFQCPFCGRFARDILPAIEKKYVDSGRMLLAFRHLPLPQHALARPAAEAAECAGRQGLFWPVHTAFFSMQDHLDKASLRSAAHDAGVDLPTFDKCLSSEETKKRVQQDVDTASSLGVSTTPLFFLVTVTGDGVGTVVDRIDGAIPFDSFERVIDKHLK